MFKNQRSAFAVASFPAAFSNTLSTLPSYLLPHLHPNIFALIYDSPLFAWKYIPWMLVHGFVPVY